MNLKWNPNKTDTHMRVHIQIQKPIQMHTDKHQGIPILHTYPHPSPSTQAYDGIFTYRYTDICMHIDIYINRIHFCTYFTDVYTRSTCTYLYIYIRVHIHVHVGLCVFPFSGNYPTLPSGGGGDVDIP